ncbi:MarR family winged helix-turn-helix transcriptional regulator [Glycomyces sp. NPDC046736]|uniref:MarR family winged helix-turn-helix transcriptional regulator n=1 Tax=Glycomyces sp. NPDC046736 TaxID=3155615 RepID=UPI0033CFB10A
METTGELRFDYDGEGPERLRRQISRLAGMTSTLMSRTAADALASIGAHKAHFVVLAVLDETGPASQAALADRTRIFRSDLVAVLNDLETGGWITRAPDPEDKRRNVITITEAGRGRLAEIDAVLEGVNEHILAPLDGGERAQLFSLLRRVGAHLAGSQLSYMIRA